MKFFKISLLVLLAIANSLSGSKAQISSTVPAFISDSLDIYIEREIKRWQVPGLAIAVVQGQNTIVSKGYGVKNIKTGEKVNENTLFQIASNSKAFTGTVLAWLHYEKRIDLDEKVIKYMPWFKLYLPEYTQLVTVRDLLCHRIGTQTFQGDFLNWGSNLSRKEIIEGLAKTPPVHPFRYKFGYNNAAFVTAGEIIPIITDTTWDDFIKHRIFTPMGMTRTFTDFLKMKNDPNSCVPHTIYKGQLVSMDLVDIDNMAASASISSCVADMQKWLKLQLGKGTFNNKSIIPSSVISETWKSNTIISDYYGSFYPKNFTTYALGWQIYDYQGHRVIEHGGGANGFVTKTKIIPSLNIGIIVYTNSDANSLYDLLANQIIEAYLNLNYRNLSQKVFEMSEPSRTSELKTISAYEDTIKQKNKPVFDLDLLIGKYKNDFYGEIEIKKVKNKYLVYFEHHPRNIATLEYLKENRLVCYHGDITCGIEPANVEIVNGKIISIKLKVNDFIDYLSYDFNKINP